LEEGLREPRAFAQSWATPIRYGRSVSSAIPRPRNVRWLRHLLASCGNTRSTRFLLAKKKKKSSTQLCLQAGHASSSLSPARRSAIHRLNFANARGWQRVHARHFSAMSRTTTAENAGSIGECGASCTAHPEGLLLPFISGLGCGGCRWPLEDSTSKPSLFITSGVSCELRSPEGLSTFSGD